jgi:hypothetical protein
MRGDCSREDEAETVMLDSWALCKSFRVYSRSSCLLLGVSLFTLFNFYNDADKHLHLFLKLRELAFH